MTNDINPDPNDGDYFGDDPNDLKIDDSVQTEVVTDSPPPQPVEVEEDTGVQLSQTAKIQGLETQVRIMGGMKADEAIELALQRAQIMQQLRHFIFKNLKPKHFCYQGKSLYLMEAGTAMAARFFTASYEVLKKIKHESILQSGELMYFYEVELKAWLAKSDGESIVEIGTASSRDSMWQRIRYEKNPEGGQDIQVKYYLPIDEIPEDKVLKKAATNAFQRAVKRLLALNAIDEDELKFAGIDISLIGKIDYNTGAQGGGGKKAVTDKQWGAIAGMGKNIVSDWDNKTMSNLKKIVKFSWQASKVIGKFNEVSEMTKKELEGFIKGGYK